MINIINLGVIGSGFIVDSFLEAALAFKDLNLYMFYSRDESIAINFKEKYNFDTYSTSLDIMAKDENLDAVYIASPNAIHHDQAILFLQNKKHVLCEKSFASNHKEALNMINTAKKNNVVIMEAMRTTVTPNFKILKANIQKIGKIRRCLANFCQYSSRYDKYKEGTVLNAFKKELSNGALMDIGVYCLAAIIHLFGIPENIKCNALMLDTGVDGQGSVILNYHHMDAVIIYSKITNSYLPSEIQGEKGSIIIDKINNFDNIKIIYKDGRVENIGVHQKENNMCYEIEEFIKLIELSHNNAVYSSFNTLDNTLNTMITMDRIRQDLNIVFPADNK